MRLHFLSDHAFELVDYYDRVVHRGRSVLELRAALVGCGLLFVEDRSGVVDVAPLAEALVDHASLSCLYIHDCDIGDDVVSRLAAILHTTRIETLWLIKVSMGSIGARSLAVALRRSPRLIKLCLNYNRIGDEGVVALAESLRYNTTLRYLDLYNTDISDIGVRSLVECLRCNGGVETVWFDSNPQGTGHSQLDQSPEQRLRNLARQRASLAVLSLCSVGDRYSKFPVVRAVGGLDWNSDGDDVAKRTLRNYLFDLEFLALQSV